jgi:C1A family cysteine protease
MIPDCFKSSESFNKTVSSKGQDKISNVLIDLFSLNEKYKWRMQKFVKTLIYTPLLIIISLISCQKESDIPDDDLIANKARYDLREHNLVTPVRNQNGLMPDGSSDVGTTVGLCWAFAGLASMESNMLKQGITENPHSHYASLSPWYLGNYIEYNFPCYDFNATSIPDLQPSTSLGYYFPDCGWGGSGSNWVGDYLIAGKEIPTWNDCPMPTAEMSARLPLSPPVTQLKKKYNIAKMPLIFADDFAGTDEYRKHIKNYIVKNGAIQSFVHLEPIDYQNMISQVVNGITYTGFRFMDKVNFNMFTYEAENHSTIFFTHAVTIIGWDDNRMVNVGGRTAKGAWLIKDSQGEASWNNGCFWVAYDDIAINVLAFGLIVSNESTYAHQSTYQTHPGMLSILSENYEYNDENSIELGLYNYLLNGNMSTTSWGVAEFPLSNKETLTAVGVFCSNRNQKLSVQVYKNNLKGTPLLTQEFILDELGYHLLKLNTEVKFLSDETMLIALGFENAPSHQRLPLCYVQNVNHDFVYPTYYGTKVEGVFHLTPYSAWSPKSALFLQAIVKK